MRRRLTGDEDLLLARRLSRRALVLGGGEAALFLLLAGRLFYLQVSEGPRYAMLAENNRVNVRILPPLRGVIVDRFGVPLADNVRNYSAVLVPEQAENPAAVLRDLQTRIGLTDEEIAHVLKEMRGAPSYAPLEIRDHLTWEQVAAVEVHLPDLPGIGISEGWARLYPFAEAAAHLVGYVGSPPKNDVQGDPLLRVPGFRIGRSGIEKTQEIRLRGRAGNSETEVNVLGREVRELRRTPAQGGGRMVLSLDAELQAQLQTRLAQEKSASAVVMDVQTGEVYALASHPSFDPNQFSRQLTQGLWDELRGDETHPLVNKAIAGQYPPGSTFKMVTALAALEAGIIDENTYVFCPGSYTLGNMKFHCWRKEGHGSVNVVAALAGSCDTFFYEVANKVGIDRIAAMARRLGLGEPLGIELSEEVSGLVPDREWKRKAKGERWNPGETVVAGIGQGFLLATPLQLATMVSRLANGGRAVRPTLFKGAPLLFWPDLDLDPRHLRLVLDGMWKVVNSPEGTAYRARIMRDGAVMAGKTGTSQVARITAAQRAAGVRNETLPWKFRHHALFVGFAPVEAPRYAVAVVVEHGVGGSVAAAPIARDILDLALQRQPALHPVEGEKI